MSFDDLRRAAARKTLEDAAAHPDATEARLLEMAADDLARPLTDDEREFFKEMGIDA